MFINLTCHSILTGDTNIEKVLLSVGTVLKKRQMLKTFLKRKLVSNEISDKKKIK